MSKDGGVFMLGAKKPSSEILQSTVALENDLPETASIGTGGSGEASQAFVVIVAIGASRPAVLTRGPILGSFVLTGLADGLSHDEIGDVSGLPAPGLETPLTFAATGADVVVGTVRTPTRGVTFFALG